MATARKNNTKASGVYSKDGSGRPLEPKLILDRRRERRQRNKDIVDNIKLSRGCENLRCAWSGIFTAEMLDFDHIDPTSKDFSIAVKISNGGSLEPILEEIKKCQVLCSNCHKLKSSESWVKKYAS